MNQTSPTHQGGLDRWRWPTALFFLTVFALVVRWYYVSTALVLNPIRGDATQYMSYAWNLLTHHTFAKDLPGAASVTPDSYRDPGYPFFLALLMKISGTGDGWYASVLLCQALLSALTVALTTHLGKLWLSGRLAFVAGVLMAVWPHSVSITGVVLSETLLSFLCAAGLLIFATACQRGSNYWGFASGVIFGAAAVTNAVLLPFGVLLAAFLAWRRLETRQLCAALAIGALLLPCGWALRNGMLPSSASSDSSKDRALQNFAQGASPDFHKAYRDSFFGDANEQKNAGIALRAVNSKYLLLNKSLPDGLAYFFHEVNEQPLRYTLWYLIGKPSELWGWSIIVGQGDIYVYPTINSPFKIQGPWIAVEAFCQSINLLLMLLATAGLLGFSLSLNLRKIATSSRSVQAALAAPFVLLAFITLVYCVLQEEPRYAIPYRPIEILMAFTALAIARRWWRGRNQRKMQDVEHSSN